ncbi:MAG TPA: histidine kinase dimerization/phospho-acceptor domain-containing protein [Candidatus Limnocylindrales bacterium]|nr:histidine kinase dimerization/phospho-acceptor domain-containing protein [Candidatus Limnocylindrales bacterium]
MYEHRATSAHATPERARAGSDLGRVSAVIEALPEAVFVTDADGRLSLTNPAADRLFQAEPVHDRDDLLSRFEEVSPARDETRPSHHPAGDGPRLRTVRPRDQPNRWFALRMVPLDATSPGGARADHAERGSTVFVLRDVTDSKDLRPEREAFLAVLSHELRTPITTIYAGSSVLARRPTLSPPATQILARDISAEAARLYDLVEDLLVLARLERQVLDPLDEPVAIGRAIDATLRMAAARLPDAPIVRRGVAHPPYVHGDATYVEQACRNLILASARYAGPGVELALIVETRVDRSAGEVSVAVIDRGPTLSDHELTRAFELPDPSAVGRLAGSGIGPFVCRHLVEAMGGRTWARNRSDRQRGVEMGFSLRIEGER